MFDMTFGRGRHRDPEEMGWWPAMDVYETGEEVIVDAGKVKAAIKNGVLRVFRPISR